LLDGVCRPEACENVFGCWEDCHLPCDESLLTSSVPSDFVISAIHLSRSSQEAREASVDLDGDGEVDNKVGEIIGILVHDRLLREPESGFGAVVSGRRVLVMRVYGPTLAGAGQRLVRVQTARIEGDATPLFDGTDRVLLDSATPSDPYLCGAWDGGRLLTDPGTETLLLPIPVTDASGGLQLAHFEGARLEGVIDATGFQGLILAGGVPETEARNLTLAAMGRSINSLITTSPDDTSALTALELFDGCPDYGHSFLGCESFVSGEGDCTEDRVVTELELRCHPIIGQIITPDLPRWRSGTEQRLSMGMKVDAVPVTVVD
jgi:hypothetical protein